MKVVYVMTVFWLIQKGYELNFTEIKILYDLTQRARFYAIIPILHWRGKFPRDAIAAYIGEKRWSHQISDISLLALDWYESLHRNQTRNLMHKGIQTNTHLINQTATFFESLCYWYGFLCIILFWNHCNKSVFVKH